MRCFFLWGLLSPVLPVFGASDFTSVKDSGAMGDGKTDDTAAFQKALADCGAKGGGIIDVPTGNYRIMGHLSIPANVTLRGTFTDAPEAYPETFEKIRGSTLMAFADRGKPDGPPFIELAGANAGLVGFTILYPEWSQKDVPPIPYPPTVAMGNRGVVNIGDISIQNCLFLNSYDAIYLVGAGRHLIRNITGYPSHCGLYLDRIADIGRVENVHFWPFVHDYKVTNPYTQWVNQNGVAFELAYADWQSLQDCFSFGYAVGYKFVESPLPPHRVSCGKMIACGADSCGQPLQFIAAHYHWEITDGEFVGRWGSKDTTAVDIGPAVSGRISFSNCAFWGPISKVLTMRAPEGIVSLENCQIQTWNDDAGAVHIEAGRAILEGNSFDRPGRNHLVVSAGAGPVVATGNLAKPFFDIQAAAGTQILQSNNQAAVSH